ncbi:MAG: hypothetical protein HYR56_12785 [Acidobacteria bacterium]|nr:hypothetical protein [Acidobacteriota bacterium]MBI3422296.1 hypothetical protein [Acidobacteriota bacterium]
MEVSRVVLRDKFDSLTGNFAQLGSLLLDAAAEMQKSGRPLSDVMVEELQTTRKDFEELRAELLRAAELFHVTPLLKPEEIPDLYTLEKLLNVVIEAITTARVRAEEEARKAEEARRALAQEAAAQQVRQETITLLNRVLLLAHKTQPNYKPLQECYAQASKLRETIGALKGAPAPLEEQTLREAQKPYQSLIYLIDEWNNLDGDQWDALREEVAQYFGKELAAQAARGQLYFQPSPAPSDPADLSGATEDDSLSSFLSEMERNDSQATTPASHAEPLPVEPASSPQPVNANFAGQNASAEVSADLPLNEWAGGNWPSLEEMAKALMEGKLALAADNAADTTEPGEPVEAITTAASKITEKDSAKNASTSRKGKGKEKTEPESADEPLPAWFNRLDDIAESEEDEATSQPPASVSSNLLAQDARSAGVPSASKAGKTAKTAKTGLAPAEPANLKSKSKNGPATAAGLAPDPTALSHWSQLLDDLSEVEAETSARAHRSENEIALNEVAAPITTTVNGKSAKRGKGSKTETGAPLTERPVLNGNAAPAPLNDEIPPPPPPPPITAPLPVAQAAELEPFEDYETTPQGFEDEDEREQTFLYVALEERNAPFYFSGNEDTSLYQLPAEFKAAQIAHAIESGAAPERLVALRDLLWRLVFERQLGLAFPLARALERAQRDERTCLPSWLIRALALSRVMRYDEGELAHQLRADLKFFSPRWLTSTSAEWDLSVSLFTAAATLRPALLAPSTKAPRVLAQLPRLNSLPLFHEFCQTIGAQCHDARPIDPGMLRQHKNKEAWQKDFQELRHEVEAWWKQAPFKELEFAPATYVWRNWCEPKGRLRTLLPTQISEKCDVAAVKRLIRQWSDERQVQREINHTDRELIGRSAGQRDIEGEAFKQLLDYSREAVDLARRWISLLETNPGRISLQPPPHLAPLREFVGTHLAGVVRELELTRQQTPALPIREALAMCIEAVTDAGDIFDAAKVISASEPKLRHALYAPLLATELPLTWRLKSETEEPESVIAALLRTIAKNLPLDWQRAFAFRSERRDHDATLYLLQYLADTGFDPAKVESMRRDREQMLTSCRAVLRQEIEETRKMITAALDLGHLPEKDYLRMAAVVDGMETAKLLRFGAAHHELLTMRQTILAKREGAIVSLREKLKLSGIGPDHYYYPQLARVLERGDLVTAEEYLGMVLDHQELPETEEAHDNFAGFYPEKAHELSDYLKQVPLYAVIQRARAGADLCGLRLKDFDLEAVAGAISAWFNTRRMQTISEEDIAKILPFLGLTFKEATLKQEENLTWITLVTDPIIGRERCPVPAYGSDAKGKYRILCVWDRPTEEELLQFVGDTSFGSPVFVFYFGQMNDDMRPALARLCRERHQTLVVIDDVLILYLYGQRAPRLHTLFEAALPFTWTEPYTATAVSPEMFYGRIQERKSIMSPTGTGFVYGGRRLGKTTLLRDVERNFHDPAQGRIAVFLDLEGENIGTQRQLDDLWLLLGEEFKRHKVVSGGHDNPTTLLDQVCQWLDGNQQRRILVLLDQADRFLEADEKEQFVRASRVRGVMEKTGRRFKFVFAGVHNIPRMTRIPDHPLAQFGTPISIGPLLGHEAQEARRLIEEPLAALGYTFESPDLVRRILWRTNYYPSLIQHYCYHLLKYLTNSNRASNSNAGPPYFVTSEDVDEAYRGQDMRAAIRAGLLATLQVDERYGVIAYLMADSLLQNDEKLLSQGFSISWISQQARYWWEEGFEAILADNALPVLLDEMVGLGILRATDNGYTLRSKGVAVLLGNEDQIAAELQRTRKMPPKYNPSTFRAARTGSPRRSPLTAQEIMEMRSRQNGLSVVFGNEAAGLTDLREFIEVATPRGLFAALDGTEHQSFIRQLNEALERQAEGTTLMLVLPSSPWEARWIEDAHQRLKDAPATRAFVRVAFIADPAKAWNLLNQQQTPFELLPGKGATAYSLKPWHDDALRQWLDDRSFSIDDDARERITAVTGNWPMLLEYFYQRSQIDSFSWMDHLRATAKDLRDKPAARDLARALGVDQTALGQSHLHALRVLLALEKEGAQTLEELHKSLNQMTEMSESAIKRVLWWAELLSLAQRVGPRWRVDHLVGRVLKTVSD